VGDQKVLVSPPKGNPFSKIKLPFFTLFRDHTYGSSFIRTLNDHLLRAVTVIPYSAKNVFSKGQPKIIGDSVFMTRSEI
jgi:hypothetical protein